MQTNDMAIMPATSNFGAGAQMPLSPPETNHMEGFQDISQMMRNDVTKDPILSRLNDDKCANLSYDDCNSTPSFTALCDNAVDPDMFFCRHQQQEKSSNTANIYWPPSPYGQLESLADPCSPNEPVSPVGKLPRLFPTSPRDASNNLERQISLNVAIELCPIDNPPQLIPDGAFLPSPASSCYTNDDEDYLQHPSPSWCPLQIPRNRTVSEFDAYFPPIPATDDSSRMRAVSADLGYSDGIDVDELLRPFAIAVQNLSDNNQPDSQTNNQNNNNNTTTSNDTTETSSSTECVVSYSQPPTTTSTKDVIAVDEESLSCFFQGTFGSQSDASIDVGEILDGLESAQNPLPTSVDEQNQQETTINMINVDHAYTSSQDSVTIVDVTLPKPASPSVTKVIDLTEAPTTSRNAKSSSSSLKRTASYTRKRNKNNEACRETRKKRKVEREDAEHKLKFLSEDNDLMREKIKQLEIEVRETRALLIGSMTKAK